LSDDPTLIPEAQAVAREVEGLKLAADEYQGLLRKAELQWDVARVELHFAAGGSTEEKRARRLMLCWSRRRLSLARAWAGAAPGGQTDDAVAEGHFSLGLSAMRSGYFNVMARNFFAQLQFKAKGGNIPGLAASLTNFGAILVPSEPAFAGGLLLTAKQIYAEVGVDTKGGVQAEDAILAHLAAPDGWPDVRAALGNISPLLPPYWERALASARGDGTGFRQPRDDQAINGNSGDA
jgi:hypothetical protein